MQGNHICILLACSIGMITGLDDTIDRVKAYQETGVDAIFLETFRQAEAGADRGGTGLGLSLSQHFVAMMGGQLSLVPEPARGSHF